MIAIVPYNPDWKREFAAERARLQAALGAIALRIDHHGSTAVPGLAAKPIIDIHISIERLQPMEPYAAALRSCGYVHAPHADDASCPFFHRPAAWPHTHHVHVVAAGSDEERHTLMFRDHLRAHPETAREYEALKRDLAARFGGGDPESREAYAAAKTTFVRSVLARTVA
jgi:GrpB-like predicted nucleotidyltransferase (UPF0157 family)